METLMFTGLLYKDIIKNIDEHPDGRDAKGKVCGKGYGTSLP